MATTVAADASPEKRLFISLLTRDISLIDAVLDILDNSINAALEPYADRLRTAKQYEALLLTDDIRPTCAIEVTFDRDSLQVRDNAGGITMEAARSTVFKFGRPEKGLDQNDRLSVYGIGLKRAVFKIGRNVQIVSDHPAGGFELDLDVDVWAETPQAKWEFPITPRPPSDEGGTIIRVTGFREEVRRRISDGVFEKQLREKISQVYTVFVERIVTITINGVGVGGLSFGVGENFSSERFDVEGVSCTVTAGIAANPEGKFRESGSGWFVFCNGRTVIFADRTALTGWFNNGLPIPQPKHRPFVGIVFFVATDPEDLPWTTTKAGINTESIVWQTARRQMIATARPIISYLDRRYTIEGTQLNPEQLQEASGTKVSVLSAAAAEKKSFAAPALRKPPTKTIQYKVKVEDIEKIERYLRRPGMGGSAVGRYTFRYFLDNEVNQ